MPKKKKTFKLPLPAVFQSFLPFAVAITLLSGLIYASAQQVYRQSANDPQIQIAEDTAKSLSNGANINPQAFDNKVDISKSLSSFVILYDDKNKPVASTAVLDGKMPSLPAGVLKTAKANGQNILTWEPKPGVRQAIVVVPFKNGATSGFVLAGKSLRQTEIRIERLTQMIALGWILTLSLTFISFLFSRLLKNN